MSAQIEDLLAGLAADPDCSESIIQMLAEQEEDVENFERFLHLIRVRVQNSPNRFNRLAIASDKQGMGYYVITNYDYKTYKWALSLGLPPEKIKVGANKIYLSASALPLKIIKSLEEKLENEQKS